ncbi:pilus assembly protein TadG-related protein [Compostimonas suwonensis]|uniref:Putative Flp pilus-assembly TadE/G-like protein n=1 Tax=Compostimonas suwonensis TaxID=1048394 RepID=A0A2M9BWR5_9MICO|nr:pilus assembly protein TadG-related protein [Compostimonas suwonensis]PJJ62380.1 putative Flp pilus-assembly TadE/G-like protein [Compostimonas suwonensis]
MTARRRHFAPDGEEGSTLPLVIAFTALCIAVILAVTAATSLYLERKRLFTLADGAALAAAESFGLDDVRTGGAGVLVQLRSDEVARVASEFVALQDSAVEGLTIVRAETVDGRSATVELAALWRPPVVSIFLPEGVPLSATSVARAVFW